jgi:hypothetical protein
MMNSLTNYLASENFQKKLNGELYNHELAKLKLNFVRHRSLWKILKKKLIGF